MKIGKPELLSVAVRSGIKPGYASDAAFVSGKGSAAAEGDSYYNTTTKRTREYTNGAWQDIGTNCARSLMIARFCANLGTETETYSLAAKSGNIIVAGTSPLGKIFKSTNGGLSWSEIGRLGTTVAVGALTCTLPNKYFVAGSDLAIYRSTNSGTSWSLIATLTGNGISDLLSISSQIVLASTGTKIYRSTDEGANFSSIKDVIVYKFAFLGSGVVLGLGINTDVVIYKSTDSGATWSSFSTVATSGTPDAIVSLGSGIVLAGLSDISGLAKIYKSTDSGENWSDKGILGTSYDIKSLLDLGNGLVAAIVHGVSGDSYYNARIFISYDSGDTWTSMQKVGNEHNAYCAVKRPDMGSDDVDFLVGANGKIFEVVKVVGIT